MSKELQLHDGQAEKLAVGDFEAKQSKNNGWNRTRDGARAKVQHSAIYNPKSQNGHGYTDVVQTLLTPKRLTMLRTSWKEPDILIGIDHAFKFLKPSEMSNLPSGCQLLNTTARFMMAGKGQLSPVEEQARKNHVGTIVIGVARDGKEETNQFCA